MSSKLRVLNRRHKWEESKVKQKNEGRSSLFVSSSAVSLLRLFHELYNERIRQPTFCRKRISFRLFITVVVFVPWTKLNSYYIVVLIHFDSSFSSVQSVNIFFFLLNLKGFHFSFEFMDEVFLWQLMYLQVRDIIVRLHWDNSEPVDTMKLSRTINSTEGDLRCRQIVIMSAQISGLFEPKFWTKVPTPNNLMFNWVN